MCRCMYYGEKTRKGKELWRARNTGRENPYCLKPRPFKIGAARLRRLRTIFTEVCSSSVIVGSIPENTRYYSVVRASAPEDIRNYSIIEFSGKPSSLNKGLGISNPSDEPWDNIGPRDKLVGPKEGLVGPRKRLVNPKTRLAGPKIILLEVHALGRPFTGFAHSLGRSITGTPFQGYIRIERAGSDSAVGSAIEVQELNGLPSSSNSLD
ncbi:hypothetical protein B0H65DRAFT_446957 [Neurospora tetraspora]|uniref:Uncharacterized protein n=1 Tax=Neurospora tetraspora TaxID=94610 RepID=A0AAE0J182_9PEZI|nr:hypothetical protein B0H65DRAFT_446957 [Neurospora tetraspora]